MNRSERLLKLLQVLRRYRYPVSGATLAQEMAISIRTLYRDIATLQGQGANIEGEPGVGYVLQPGFMLPPLMFTPAELETLMLGMRWVEKFADSQMTAAATDALAKISAVLPATLRHELDRTTLLVGPRTIHPAETIDLDVIRQAMRQERKLVLHYLDGAGKLSIRTIWPFALGYFQECRILAAWCEKRQDFRHFRTDRMREMHVLPERYPKRQKSLLAAWRKQQSDHVLQPDRLLIQP